MGHHSGEAEDLSCDGARLRQTLKVVAVKDGYAELEAFRASACKSCAAHAGCGAGALAELIGGRQTLRLPYAQPLHPGDEVTVTMESGAFLKAALRAYLLPPAALIAVAAGSVSLGLSDLTTAALCIPALALSLLPLYRAERREMKSGSLHIESVNHQAAS